MTFLYKKKERKDALVRMKLFKVSMYNKLTKKVEESYICSRNAKTAAKDLGCYRSHNYHVIDSVLA